MPSELCVLAHDGGSVLDLSREAVSFVNEAIVGDLWGSHNKALYMLYFKAT